MSPASTATISRWQRPSSSPSRAARKATRESSRPHPVRQARKEAREIVYTLDEGHGLKPGDPVRITIDWPRRYRLMRLHFAAEIVLELTYRQLGSIEKIGAHIAEDSRW